ncbi:fibronectin type III domain-containing protein [Candidatus Poriferisocius sp.]|uniref:fibronectin type III domain-containing protein n=1 Tax=Candidatus Poriferisocius sp. TaxID=3101276 RepID=UPI003B02AF09
MGAQSVPNTPSSPQVVVLGGGAVRLSWGPPPATVGVVGYEYVFSRSTDGGTNWVPPSDRVKDTSTGLAPTSGDRSGVVWRPVPGGGAARSVVVSGLTVGSRYQFWVRAVNAAGAGQIVSMSPGDGDLVSDVAPVPGGLRAVPGDSQVELKWTKADGAVAGSGFADILRYEYAIKQGDGGWSAWSSMPDLIRGSSVVASGDRDSFVVSGLTNDVGYSFRVRAVNKHGAGAFGVVGPVVVGGAPGAPRNFVVMPGDKSALLSWQPPGVVGSPVTGWEVRWSDGNYGTLAEAGWNRVPGGAGARSYYVTGLDNNQSYLFEVRAVNALGGGLGARSGFVYLGALLGAPRDLKTPTVTESSVTLDWRRPANFSSSGDTAGFRRYEYSLRAGDGDWGGWVVIPGGYTTTEFEVRGLTAGTGYRFRLRAVNVVGGGAVAETGVVYPGTVPLAPAVVAEVVSDYTIGLHQVILSWTGSNGGSPVIKWQLKRATTVDGLTSAVWHDLCDNTEGADPGCGGLSTVMFPRYRTFDYQNATGCFVGLCVGGLVVGDHFFVLRAENARGVGLESEVVRVNIARGVPSMARTAVLRGYTGDPRTDGRPHMGVNSPASYLHGGTRLRFEWSWKVGGGPWGGWVTQQGSLTGATELFDEMTFRVGETYTFRTRTVSDLGVGYAVESEPFIFGAPPLPGAAAWEAFPHDRPEVLAVPGNGQVKLNIVKPKDRFVRRGGGFVIGYENAFVDTDGTYDGTVWEYSYRPVGGEWSPWAVSNTGERFADRAANSADVAGDGIVVSGLRNGVAYEFRVRARNRHGTGWLVGPVLYSNGAGLYNKAGDVIPDKVAIPGVAPPAPAGLTASGGDSQVTLSWTSVGSGGPPIIRWEYRQQSRAAGVNNFEDWGDWTTVPGSGPLTTSAVIKGLTNGTTYRFRLRAVNALMAFDSEGVLETVTTDVNKGAQAQSLAVTPGNTPTAPRQVAVVPGDREVRVSLLAPVSGSAVLAYEVRMRRTGQGTFDAWESLGARITPPARHLAESVGVPVRGLVNGVAYDFEVRAVNQFGAGPAAGVVGPITPVGAPAGGSLQATAGDGQVTLSWAEPNTGGSVVTGWQYRMKTDGGGYGSWTAATGGAAARGLVVDGLANGRAYTFQVRAITTNVQVIGAAFESEPVTPSAVPPAPTVKVTAGNMMVTLNWSAGDGGAVGESNWAAVVTGWQYRMKTGTAGYGAWSDVPAATTTREVDGLVNGVAYIFEVRARNRIGSSTVAIATATPAAVPAAPTVTTTAGDKMVTVSWTAGDNGGSAVTGWQLRTGTDQWVSYPAGTTSVPVQNLANGTTYTFQVRAQNAMGAGAVGVDTAMPATVPAAPTVATTSGDGTVTLSWTPGTDGGSAVTGWHLRVDDGQWQDLAGMGLGADATSVPVPNLTNGTSYAFHLRARNAMGAGAVASVSAMPAAVPAAPSVTATATDGTITVTWVAGADGGSVVTGWQWRTRVGSAGFGEWADVGAVTMSTVISGTNTGTGPVAYTFEVRAVNAIGAGPAGTSPTVTPGEDAPGGDTPSDQVYYSGPVTGPSFCAEFSLGGVRLFALDSDGDGVADICSLPYTRREAIARQNAVITLANRYPDLYSRLVNAECANQPGSEACGGEELAAPGFPPPNDGGAYYSGTITGPSWCANRSLGGPTTYPLDSDGDGVADVCSLPYTRREAIARQKAGDTLAATYRDEYRAALAEECRRLGRGNYGDSVADLNNDICNN